MLRTNGQLTGAMIGLLTYHAGSYLLSCASPRGPHCHHDSADTYLYRSSFCSVMLVLHIYHVRCALYYGM